MLNLWHPRFACRGQTMEDATTDCGACDETVVFLSYFKDLKDPRQQGKVTYPLDEILLLCLLAVLAGAETVVDIALAWPQETRTLAPLSPVQGRQRRPTTISVTSCMRARRRAIPDLLRCLGRRTDRSVGGGDAIDGKTSQRRSGRKNGGNPAIHMVSAFAARQRLVLGQVKVADKANEINSYS